MQILAKRNTLRAALIVEHCVRNGITTFAIAPGSRSTPLTLAAAQHPSVTTRVHFDERGLSFWALGYAKASGKPVAIITTSGTAVANCLPALCEASQTNIPLLMISADRPEELHGVGANQTMPQDSLFGEHVRVSKTLPLSDEALSDMAIVSELQTIIDHAVQLHNPGPVHLNCQLREPLYSPVATLTEDIQDVLIRWKNPGTSVLRDSQQGAFDVSTEDVMRKISHGKGIFLVGDIQTSDADSVLKCANQFNIPIVADIQSGLRHVSVSLEALTEADWILVFGSRFVSKSLLSLIKDTHNNQIWVSPYAGIQNPTSSTFNRWSLSISSALAAISTSQAPQIKRQFSFRNSSAECFYDRCIQTISNFIGEQAVFIGNSSIVRRCDRYWESNSERAQWVYTNRGVSGIDGNIATITGIADAKHDHVIALLGDITTLHDMSSLNLIKHSQSRIDLVVFNDKGGRIFEKLPVAKQTDKLDDMFVLPHSIHLEYLMKAHDIQYFSFEENTSQSELEGTLKKPFTKCIEIRLYD